MGGIIDVGIVAAASGHRVAIHDAEPAGVVIDAISEDQSVKAGA
jgi:hypothetical protein